MNPAFSRAVRSLLYNLEKQLTFPAAQKVYKGDPKLNIKRSKWMPLRKLMQISCKPLFVKGMDKCQNQADKLKVVQKEIKFYLNLGVRLFNQTKQKLYLIPLGRDYYTCQLKNYHCIFFSTFCFTQFSEKETKEGKDNTGTVL